MSLKFHIQPPDRSLAPALQDRIDHKTKPLGALGRLEPLALQIGQIQRNLTPVLLKPCVLVFAGDHGIAEAGVSAYPQNVTGQMVGNFVRGGAAINVFARQHGINLRIVDAGVNADLDGLEGLIDAKQGFGTANFLFEPAMSSAQCHKAMRIGSELVDAEFAEGCNCIGFGEMGIGNSSSAALLLHCLTDLPLVNCVGRGTGVGDDQYRHKLSILEQARARHGALDGPIATLSVFGGFELAMMAGAYLKAAELGMLVLVDGFIASAALLVAASLYPAVLDYCVFSHVSSERGHRALLARFKASPLLDLDLRLGEGSGITLAFPLVQAAVGFLNDMASFAEAGVDSDCSQASSLEPKSAAIGN